MTNLIPEQRLDKNGVLTTKHVRADPRGAAKKGSLPAPALGALGLTANAEQKWWQVGSNKWDCDEELAYLVQSHFSATQAYKCSDTEAYELLGVVHPSNVFPLLSIGIRTQEKAKAFLEGARLTRLNMDYSAMAAEAVNRGYGARKFLNFATAYSEYTDDSVFMDAAEVHFDPDLEGAEMDGGYNLRNQALEDMVINGLIRVSDIKEIGSEFIREHSAVQGDIYTHLKLLNENKTVLESASAIKQVILDAERFSMTVTSSLAMASAYGPQIPDIARGANTVQAWRLAMKLRDAGRSAEENVTILEYAIVVPEHEAAIALYEAGVSKEDAARGWQNELTVEQTIALAKKTVTSSLASGVL